MTCPFRQVEKTLTNVNLPLAVMNCCVFYKGAPMTKTYTRPVLHVQGKLEEMTHGMRVGKKLDADYNTGTPEPELTFS